MVAALSLSLCPEPSPLNAHLHVHVCLSARTCMYEYMLRVSLHYSTFDPLNHCVAFVLRHPLPKH